MKALTVQQPWAWAIVHGGKTIENRTQAWKYRGPLAIHAGARWSDRGAADPHVRRAVLNFYGTRAPLDEHQHWYRGEAPGVLGALVGVVDLVDVHEARMLDEESGCCDPWGMQEWPGKRNLVHLVLENPRPLDRPIPCRGALGLWNPPAEVLDELREAL